MTTRFFDIETKPREDLVDKFLEPFPEFDPSAVKMGNIKDPKKAQAHIESKRHQHNQDARNHRRDSIDKAALKPQTAQIITIQTAVDDGEVEIIHGDEKEMLEKWWEIVADNHGWMVNWTGRNDKSNFDWKHIYRKSWSHGLAVPHVDHTLIVNLAERFLKFEDWNIKIRLENAAKELGIEVDDCDGVTGKDFWKYWESDREKALVYAKQDVILMQQIWGRMNRWEK